MSFHDVNQFLAVMPWFAWVGIVGIVCGSISKIVEQHHRHEERLAMIRQGMSPDGGKMTQPEL